MVVNTIRENVQPVFCSVSYIMLKMAMIGIQGFTDIRTCFFYIAIN